MKKDKETKETKGKQTNKEENMKITKLVIAFSLAVTTATSHSLWANQANLSHTQSSVSQTKVETVKKDDQTIDVSDYAIPQGSECISGFDVIQKRNGSRTYLPIIMGGILAVFNADQADKYVATRTTRFFDLSVEELEMVGYVASAILIVYGLSQWQAQRREKTVQAVVEAYDFIETSSVIDSFARKHEISQQEAKLRIRAMNESGELCEVYKDYTHRQSEAPHVRDMILPVEFDTIEF